MDLNNITIDKCFTKFSECLAHLNREVNVVIESVNSQENGLIIAIVVGLILGIIFQYSRLTSFEKVAGFSTFEDTVLIKIVTLTIGLSSLGLYFMVDAGYATYTIEPYSIVLVSISAILFGAASAILGQTIFTGVASIASGRVDILFGLFGGLLAGYLFVANQADIASVLEQSTTTLSLFDLFDEKYAQDIVLGYSILFIVISFIIPLKEYKDDNDCEVELLATELESIDLDSSNSLVEKKDKKEKVNETDEFFV